MPDVKAHTIIIDGAEASGKKMLTLELALVLLYNKQRTALVLTPGSPLHKTLELRKKQYPYLPIPDIIAKEDFYTEANKYDAIILPASADSDLKLTAKTYITLLGNKNQPIPFQRDLTYINSIWELKKRIASAYNRSLDWVVCENMIKKISSEPTPELAKISRMYGFRPTPPLNNRISYQNNISGLSAQDKIAPELQKTLTYEDICAKREILKLAEFIFS